MASPGSLAFCTA